MSKLLIYSDGASKGNPGDAGIGVVIATPDNEPVREISDYIGVVTNNVAEYEALIRGLEAAAELGADSVDILTDSELLARQVAGIYRVKSPNLKPLYEKAIRLLKAFRPARITHVRREFNTRADELANEGIKTHRKKQRGVSKPQMPRRKADQGAFEL